MCKKQIQEAMQIWTGLKSFQSIAGKKMVLIPDGFTDPLHMVNKHM